MNLVKTNLLKIDRSNEIQGTNCSKHFPVSTREWNNSIYVYNKNALNLIPVASISATKIIKSYFSLFNPDVEKELRTEKLPLRRRKSSNNRIFIGNNEFKHTNNKVIINLYLFNRQEKNYFIALKKSYNYWKKRKRYNWKEYMKRYNVKGVYWKEYKHISMRIYYMSYILDLFTKEHERKKYLLRHIDLVNRLSKKKWGDNLELSFIELKEKMRKIILEKYQLYFYYRQLIYINKSKFNYNYLHKLKKYLQAIYNKDIEFNLIKLKRFYLNSNILSESVKLKLTKNRRRIFRHLSKLKNKVKIKKKNPLKPAYLDNENIINIPKNIIKNIKYKDVTGFRLEAKGRLTRRHTASRSVTKVKYKGNLLNIDSSHRGLSTILLKGNLESNLQYTKLKSKTRIGSFGLKGWVSGN